ncbi:MAG: hypothetical protein E7223_00760 [Clostridiales bacterium]|nr:hypothetical protein [Clostridiales bacterium]
MIDPVKQKTIVKRNLIFLAILLALFVIAWVYVSLETREYTITAYGFSESLQKYREVEVKNPFAKHVFLRCSQKIHETEPLPTRMGPYVGVSESFSIRKGETGKRHTHTGAGTQALCFNSGNGMAEIYDKVPRKVISQIEYCIDLCVR